MALIAPITVDSGRFRQGLADSRPKVRPPVFAGGDLKHPSAARMPRGLFSTLGGFLALLAGACAPVRIQPPPQPPAAPSAPAPVRTPLVLFMEPNPFENGELGSHARMVRDAFLNGCPDATERLRFSNSEEGRVGSGEASWQSFIDERSEDSLNTLSDHIERILRKEPDVRIVNVSYASSRYFVYESILKSIREGNEALKRDLLGGQDAPDETALKAAIVAFVDRHLDQPGSKFQQALQRYQEVTARAAQAGLWITVAVGNDQDNVRRIYPTAGQGAAFNFLGMSDFVFKVGASGDPGTPGDVTDDRLVSFSSHGTGRFNPDVITTGVNVPTSRGATSGTSLSAPLLACALDESRETDRRLTFDEVRRLLQQTAHDTETPPEGEGAGVLDREKLLATVRQRLQGVG